MRRLVLALLAALVVLAPSFAEAHPSLSTLASIDHSSKLVAIVKFVGPAKPKATGYDLVVERVLRGSAKPGSTIHVKASPDGHAYFAPGARIVAFIDAAGTWNAYASLLAGPTLEDGVLHLAGFDDFDAHLVTPGVMTLAQLKAYLRGKPLAWTFRGKILLATRNGLKPSSIEVTARAPGNAVSGMPKLAGFPTPTVRVGSWSDTAVTITYTRDLGRPLELEGKAIGKNADGSIAVEFRTYYPGLLTEADFRRYVGDAKLGHPYYTLRLDTAGKSLPVVLEKELGRIGTIGGKQIGESSLAPGRYIKAAGGIVIRLATTKFKRRSIGTSNALVEEAMLGPIACTFKSPARSSPCKFRYVATHFAAP